MHSERTRGVLGPTLCEARPQHLPRPGEAGPFYTTKAVHDIEAGPDSSYWTIRAGEHVISELEKGLSVR